MFVWSFVCPIVHSFIRSFDHPLIHFFVFFLFIHSLALAHPFVRSFIHLFGCLFVHSYHLHPPLPVYYLIVVCCHCQLSGWLLRCNGGMDTPFSLLVLILILVLVLVLVLVSSLSSSSSSSCHRHRHHPSSSFIILLHRMVGCCVGWWSPSAAEHKKYTGLLGRTQCKLASVTYFARGFRNHEAINQNSGNVTALQSVCIMPLHCRNRAIWNTTLEITMNPYA